jgi:hypothetical protein
MSADECDAVALNWSEGDILEEALSEQPRTLEELCGYCFVPRLPPELVRPFFERQNWQEAGVSLDASGRILYSAPPPPRSPPRIWPDQPPRPPPRRRLAPANGHAHATINDDVEPEFEDIIEEPEPPPEKPDPLKVKLLGKQRKQLGHLWRFRDRAHAQRGEMRVTLADWFAALGINVTTLYDPADLATLTQMTIEEDWLFATVADGRRPLTRVRLGKRQVVTACQFPDRVVPVGETRQQRVKRRRAFQHRQRKKPPMTTDNSQRPYVAPPRGNLASGKFAATTDRAGRLVALLDVLPSTSKGAITVGQAAKRARSHPAWQPNGKPMTLSSLEVLIRQMRADDRIGSEWRVAPSPGFRLWRR